MGYEFLTREVLEKHYWIEMLSSREIAEKYSIKHDRTVRKIMERLNVPRRTVSESITKHPKIEMDGSDLATKSYLLGLRAGDFHAKRIHKIIRVQTTTTRKAQLDMMRNTFELFSRVGVHEFYNKKFGCKQYFLYCDLLPSFSFLLKKPERIPRWVLKDNGLFFHFLAAYSDCEASWKILRSHSSSVRFVFSIRTYGKPILEDIRRELRGAGIKSHIYFDSPKGKKTNHGYCHRKDLYNITIYRKNDIETLISRLIPLSKHEEKIRKMRLIQNHMNDDWETTRMALDRYRTWFRQEQTLESAI